MPEPVVRTHQLAKHYGPVHALTDCTLDVERGEVFGLLGPNGSGKTTLLRLLLGFLRPTAGSAAVEGLDCYHDSLRVHAGVSYLPGEARLFRRMRGDQVLRFFSRVRPQGDLSAALGIARRLQLDLSRQVARCSTGMRQKLALAAVLSADVPLLILDEPTANLDPTARRTVLQMVAEARAAGRTVIFSSHVLSEVEDVCDRVVLLREGRPVHTQVMAQLRRRHRIRAHLTGPLTPPPEGLAGLDLEKTEDGRLQFETPGDLAPLLDWLARLPLEEIQIEPLGLKAVYEQVHPDLENNETQ